MNNEELLMAIRQIVKEEIEPVKTDVSGLKTDMTSVKADVSGLKTDMTGVKEDLSIVKSTLKEHGQLIRALEHKVDVIKAKQESMKHDVNMLVGNFKTMEMALNAMEATTIYNWNEIAKLKSTK